MICKFFDLVVMGEVEMFTVGHGIRLLYIFLLGIVNGCYD